MGTDFLGPAALFTSPPLLQGSGVWAEQRPAVNGANAAAVGEPAKSQAAYRIQVIKQAGDKLKLRGLVASAEDHKALLGLVKASFPSADVYDRVKVDDSSKADSAKADMKLGSVSFALKALSYLQSGSAKIDEQSIALYGIAETRAVYTEVKNLIDFGPADRHHRAREHQQAGFLRLECRSERWQGAAGRRRSRCCRQKAARSHCPAPVHRRRTRRQHLHFGRRSRELVGGRHPFPQGALPSQLRSGGRRRPFHPAEWPCFG